MPVILVTAFLSVLAVLGLAWRLPSALRQPTTRQTWAVLIWGPPPPRHRADLPDPRSPLQRWEDGPGSMDLAAELSARARQHLPPPRYTAQQLTDMDAGLDQARAIAAEPRPGLLMLPAPTTDTSGPPGPPWDRPAPPGAPSALLPPNGDQLPPDDPPDYLGDPTEGAPYPLPWPRQDGDWIPVPVLLPWRVREGGGF